MMLLWPMTKNQTEIVTQFITLLWIILLHDFIRITRCSKPSWKQSTNSLLKFQSEKRLKVDKNIYEQYWKKQENFTITENENRYICETHKAYTHNIDR